MKISVGIMAYNEERNIARTLEALARQTLLRSGRDVEVRVVVNGSTDRTATVAEEAAARHLRTLPGVAAAVDVLAQAGKANAWNCYVHELADRAAGILILADADILFGEDDCLERLVAALEQDPHAHASVDLILKDIARKARKTALEKLSLAASEAALAGPPKLAGSLYAARAEVLRRIWMPLGMLVEDGFLKAMILTDGFRGPEDLRRLVRAPGATHYFEAVTEPGALFRHEKRLVNGTRMNIVLFAHLRERVAAGEAAGEVVRRRNGEDPAWFGKLAREHLAAHPELAPGSLFVLQPMRQLRHLRPLRALACLPGAVARSLFNLAVVRAANRDLRENRLRW